ncbi:MAG: DUF2491 family protein [Hafnia sp.]
MGFLDYIRSFFGGNSTAAKAARIERDNGRKDKEHNTVVTSTGYPMEIDINRVVTIDQLTLDILKGKTNFLIPGLNEQQVSAIGTIELGQGISLYRIYLDDGDTWIQFACSGGVTKDSIDDVGVFSYNKAETPTSEYELARLAGPNSALGLPKYSFEGAEYQREWGSEEGQTELSAYTELVRNESGEQYYVEHRAMLYSRPIENTQRNELLLISVEECESENDQKDITVTMSVGVTLQTSDLSIH